MADNSPLVPEENASYLIGEGMPFDAPWKLGLCQDQGARQEQQDSVGFMLGRSNGKPALLTVLGDGMGGMKDGAAFSRIAVGYHLDHFQEDLNHIRTPSGVLLSLALRANAEAYRIYNDDHPGGTTLLSALFIGDAFYTLSVGDSRIILFRKENNMKRYVPLQINRDHILGAALDERAWMGYISHEDAEGNVFRHSLSSSIGSRKVKRVDFTDYPTQFLPGDRLALMSDGIYKTIPEEKMAIFMNDEPRVTASNIVREAKSRGLKDQDNMSIMIVQKL